MITYSVHTVMHSPPLKTVLTNECEASVSHNIETYLYIDAIFCSRSLAMDSLQLEEQAPGRIVQTSRRRVQTPNGGYRHLIGEYRHPREEYRHAGGEYKHPGRATGTQKESTGT